MRMPRCRAADSLSFLLFFTLCLGLSAASSAESASGPVAEKDRSITGTVTDPAGRPLPGAEVELGRDRSRLIQMLDETPSPLRIVLPASGRVPGRVVDPEGHSVPGARVSAAMEAVGPPSDVIDLYDPCPQTNSNALATTDAQGRFV